MCPPSCLEQDSAWSIFVRSAGALPCPGGPPPAPCGLVPLQICCPSRARPDLPQPPATVTCAPTHPPMSSPQPKDALPAPRLPFCLGGWGALHGPRCSFQQSFPCLLPNAMTEPRPPPPCLHALPAFLGGEGGQSLSHQGQLCTPTAPSDDEGDRDRRLLLVAQTGRRVSTCKRGARPEDRRDGKEKQVAACDTARVRRGIGRSPARWLNGREPGAGGRPAASGWGLCAPAHGGLHAFPSPTTGVCPGGAGRQEQQHPLASSPELPKSFHSWIAGRRGLGGAGEGPGVRQRHG